MSFLDKMKKAGKGVMDAGAKTMLKVRTFRGVVVALVVVHGFLSSWRSPRLLEAPIFSSLDGLLFML
jgi:hypothetical protein